MIEFPSYPKVRALGHREIEGILDSVVWLQEKIDGSQINFMWDEDEILHVKSKGTWQFGGPENRIDPDKMFSLAINYLLELEPRDLGITFRGEMISKPKQNMLAYERVPEGYIILFDFLTKGWAAIDPTDMNYTPFELLPAVPVNPKLEDVKEIIAKMLEEPSILGGMREGIVIKNYDKFTDDGKIMVGKYVSPKFIERHAKDWKNNNPSKGDYVQHIIDNLNTEARFQKAVQHLAEAGQLEGTPRDIGALMKEVKRDVLDEENDWITDQLRRHFVPHIERGLGRGLAEWYKDELFKNA